MRKVHSNRWSLLDPSMDFMTLSLAGSVDTCLAAFARDRCKEEKAGKSPGQLQLHSACSVLVYDRAV
jgi:hypothetical protein